MDWFSWLSKTSLDQALVYEYGLLFSRNKLQLDDIVYFDHEFLQSMGVSMAKHRLEILKIAKKQNGVVSAFRKTRNCWRKWLQKLGFHEEEQKESMEEKGTSFSELKIDDFKPRRSTAAARERALGFSGPLDGASKPRLMNSTRSLKLSGPLDGKIERLLIKRSPKCSGPVNRGILRSPSITGAHRRTLEDGFVGPNKSPRVSGSLICSHCNKERVEFEEDDPHLWASLFRDMKPT